jgi:recombination protein RecA
MGIVKKSGAWYTYEGEQLGQGREKAKEFLTDNPELMVTIYARICDEAGIGQDPEAADVPLGEGPGDDDPILVDD